MTRTRSLYSLLPLSGFFFNPFPLMSSNEGGKAIKSALRLNLNSNVPVWQGVDKRLCELFNVYYAKRNSIERLGWESWWLHVQFSVSWTENDIYLKEGFLREFAEGLTEARARGRNMTLWNQQNSNKDKQQGEVLVYLDEWLDFLREFYPSEDLDGESQCDNPFNLRPEDVEDYPSNRSVDDTVFDNNEDMDDALTEAQLEYQHQDKKYNVLVEMMEDMAIEDDNRRKISERAEHCQQRIRELFDGGFELFLEEPDVKDGEVADNANEEAKDDDYLEEAHDTERTDPTEELKCPEKVEHIGEARDVEEKNAEEFDLIEEAKNIVESGHAQEIERPEATEDVEVTEDRGVASDGVGDYDEHNDVECHDCDDDSKEEGIDDVGVDISLRKRARDIKDEPRKRVRTDL
ncbi:uncharacterized protein F4822DRAFT_233772 [Hypoxylon trugodes]|uniref:uncharacterized protein n=1 Tax=Hypoxylon trugodes TaxID=326681 RepID=UPI00219E6268|nr:uncharacterized protein F4822DRAFT_233772 [Hypoxylon trugodes]KAI1390358.1 hypothetical protein F4822DRAFT_233772 [Hypoxylon trugodes]